MQNQIAFVDDILTSEQTAKLLGVDHRTFLNKKQRGEFKGLNSYTLPKMRGFRFIKSEVIEWVRSYPDQHTGDTNKQQTVSYLPLSPQPTKPKKRGRPRKAQ